MLRYKTLLEFNSAKRIFRLRKEEAAFYKKRKGEKKHCDAIGMNGLVFGWVLFPLSTHDFIVQEAVLLWPIDLSSTYEAKT